MELPKYARWERERKYVAWPEGIPHVLGRPYWTIEDRYLWCGRLRLRAITESDTGRQTFKLCKKFPNSSPWSAPIVNIYLSREEHSGLTILPGTDMVKRRYHDRFDGHTFGIDVFNGELAGLVLCEIEAPTVEALHRIAFPPYAAHEVTGDAFFAGGNLCTVSGAALRHRLAPWRQPSPTA